MNLEVKISVKSNIMFVRLKGDMDEDNLSDLRDKLSKMIDDYGVYHLVLNLERLTFLDSSGIGLIIGRYHQLKKKGGDVTLCNVNDRVERIIKLSGLLRICKIRDTEETARLMLGVVYE